MTQSFAVAIAALVSVHHLLQRLAHQAGSRPSELLLLHRAQLRELVLLPSLMRVLPPRTPAQEQSPVPYALRSLQQHAAECAARRLPGECA